MLPIWYDDNVDCRDEDIFVGTGDDVGMKLCRWEGIRKTHVMGWEGEIFRGPDGVGIGTIHFTMSHIIIIIKQI